jgi:DNA (cytosine-5)-methyltransferase 1
MKQSKNLLTETKTMPKNKAKRPVVAKTAISLFSGAGGDSLGLKRAGYNVVAFSEFKKPAIATHLEEFPYSKLLVCPETGSNDITKIPTSVFESYYNQVDLMFYGFPCFTKDTLVLTNNGYKEIQNVLLSDMLLTHTGKFQNIVNLQRKTYNGTLYDLKLKYHPEIITATEEHPFYVREKTKSWNKSLRKNEYSFGEPQWKNASKLTMNDYFGMVINTKDNIPSFTFEKRVNKSRYDTITVSLDKPDEWFMMGYFIGDGWIENTKKEDGRNTHKIRFAFHKDDGEIIERIKKVLPITDKNAGTGESVKYGCADFTWFNILNEFGKYAYGKRIPEWVQDAPKHLIQEFINGYKAADGCTLKKGCDTFTTVSYNLAYGVQRLYLKLGHLVSINKTIRPKTCVIQGRTCNQKDTYQIRFHPNNKNRYSSFIEGNYVWYAPFTINTREIQDEPVYNFEVDIDNSYVVCNTIVHNCQGFSQAGKKKADDPRNELVYDCVRATNAIKPKYIIGENVSGLLSRKGKDPKTGALRPVIDIIRDIFAEIGYNITYKVLKASDYGVPQERKRLIIVGCKAELGYPHMPWDSLTATVSPSHNSIRPFLETHLEGAIEFSKDNIPDDLLPHYTNDGTLMSRYWIITSAKEVSGKPHPNLIRLANGIRNRSSKEKEEDGEDGPLTIKGGLISFGVRKSAYHGQILDPDMASKTIICTYGTCPRLFVGLYNPDEDKYWVRCLSVKELGQIQGFPVEYKWQGNEKDIITQIGNAVPPALCEAVVCSLPNIIFKSEPQIGNEVHQDGDDEEDDTE